MRAELRFVCCTAHGRVLGESNGACHYPDSVVAQARHMGTSGVYYRDIDMAVGASLGSVHLWCNGGRAAHSRVIVKRVKSARDPVPETPE